MTVEKVNFPKKSLQLKRVCAYARVSTQKDSMLHSLSAQVEYYKKLIDEHKNWQFCGVYADEGITGTKKDRKGFLEMLTECENGNIDMIITKSISRFARNTITLLETVRELKNINVDVFFEEQNIHSLSSDGELMLTILASFAQEESRSASENQKWRIKASFEKGELINFRFLYGYDVIDGEILINENESRIIKEIFKRVVDGESLYSIAKDLNKRNIKCKQGGDVTVGRLTQTLSNEKYTGNALLGKHYRNNHIEKKKCKNNGERDMYYAENTHPAIIDRETFDKVQLILEKNKEDSEKLQEKQKSYLSGKISCSLCGKNYNRRKNWNIIFWDCSTYLRQGKNKCLGHRIKENDLFRAFELNDIQKEDISHITVKNDTLQIQFNNNDVKTITCHQSSRVESWTDEKKQVQRNIELERRKQNADKSKSDTGNDKPGDKG